ncbi:unnamed protein product [Peniophora sp. CBMAI 1063]|nr:unnamed protein product [Peniophora sp. CBMAI 1063]
MDTFRRINTDFDYRTAVIFEEQTKKKDCVVFRGAGVVGVTGISEALVSVAHVNGWAERFLSEQDAFLALAAYFRDGGRLQLVPDGNPDTRSMAEGVIRTQIEGRIVPNGEGRVDVLEPDIVRAESPKGARDVLVNPSILYEELEEDDIEQELNIEELDDEHFLTEFGLSIARCKKFAYDLHLGMQAPMLMMAVHPRWAPDKGWIPATNFTPPAGSSRDWLPTPGDLAYIARHDGPWYVTIRGSSLGVFPSSRVLRRVNRLASPHIIMSSCRSYKVALDQWHDFVKDGRLSWVEVAVLPDKDG